MATYHAAHGTVLVIRYPVAGTGGASEPPLPPITITPPPAQAASTESLAYTVWEPYVVRTTEENTHGYN